MHFNPVIIPNLFTPDDHSALLELVNSGETNRSWKDLDRNRGVKRFTELDEIYSKKLEPLARKIFNDPTLKTSYAAYLDYNKPTSKLPAHKDNNACTYTIDYCLSANTPWGVVVEDQEFIFSDGEGLAFMGGYDKHWREDMPDPENNRVQVVMFHFCPEDHWYFTEGPDYVYELQARGDLDTIEVDTYELSPKYLEKTQKK
jgi:hypothetical protein